MTRYETDDWIDPELLLPAYQPASGGATEAPPGDGLEETRGTLLRFHHLTLGLGAYLGVVALNVFVFHAFR